MPALVLTYANTINLLLIGMIYLLPVLEPYKKITGGIYITILTILQAASILIAAQMVWAIGHLLWSMGKWVYKRMMGLWCVPL